MTRDNNRSYPRYHLKSPIEKINEHTSIRESSIHCACSSSVGRVSGARAPACTRGNNLLLRKTVLVSSNRHKNEIILEPTVINENEFFLAKKYLSMKGLCSVDNRILDNVGTSLPSTYQTSQTRSTYVYQCICKTVVG